MFHMEAWIWWNSTNQSVAYQKNRKKYSSFELLTSHSSKRQNQAYPTLYSKRDYFLIVFDNFLISFIEHVQMFRNIRKWFDILFTSNENKWNRLLIHNETLHENWNDTILTIIWLNLPLANSTYPAPLASCKRST